MLEEFNASHLEWMENLCLPCVAAFFLINVTIATELALHQYVGQSTRVYILQEFILDLALMPTPSDIEFIDCPPPSSSGRSISMTHWNWPFSGLKVWKLGSESEICGGNAAMGSRVYF